ncbi:YigZ family protein [Salicibibacter halophilus]|uniref:YigZ family protein n=1 Tax=Salicibibacter halophilus TaxID=2502791 RepID=A0A514LJ04_9BACI|nr:YigZ family protein [Salicibibacter halophilus]QDI91830.1 YigZ family protein [Salicibibacter halophilus]
MCKSYYTIKHDDGYEQTIKKSRFIAYMRRVKDEDEAKAFIAEIKNQHRDAAHNCSAYVLGMGNEIQKANDDGEPSGTAGVPMLNVLIKQELKNTAVVVTRYFGGIKLGAGGLIRAYGNSVTEAITHIGIVQRQPVQKFIVTIAYDLLGKIENELRESSYTLLSIDYGTHVDIHVAVNIDDKEAFEDWMVNTSNNHVTITASGTSYMEKDA